MLAFDDLRRMGPNSSSSMFLDRSACRALCDPETRYDRFTYSGAMDCHSVLKDHVTDYSTSTLR